ncbi:uncharacterized protein LOC124207823 isoform X2 [Daphnia pulex]|uniref:uncharacterized protein LOC124207823 isoform X2 n=1 Tax=Daphnia pulex TaxID=6669 RepID=UPI001EDF2596|nr:uncharacterized protein LOC124207823 isoform X2 [Daphnia pulex]
MSPRYGGYQITTPPSYNRTTSNVTTSYFTKPPNYYTEEAECCTATYAAPVYFTEVPKYYSAPSYYQRLLTTLRPPSIKLQLTLPPDTTLKLRSYPPPRKWNTPTYASPPYYTRQPALLVTKCSLDRATNSHAFGVVLLLGVLSLIAGLPLVYQTPPRLGREKFVKKEREKAMEISRVRISDPATTVLFVINCNSILQCSFQLSIMVNYGVVLPLVIVYCWVDHCCTDVSWVWRILNRNVAA